jgi:adenylylsulfate kinase-like enzyme
MPKRIEAKLENFTGIDDPHEVPEHAELNFELTEANAKNLST